MTGAEIKTQLRGVLGFPVTPFRDDLKLDLDALAQNVDVMAQHPFCAIVAAGGTGEIYSLAVEEIVEVVRTTVQAVGKRMPVVAGVGFNTPIAVELAERLEKAGADALLVMPPYYINAPREGLYDYYAAVGAASELPVIIYSRDWAVFTPEMVARLADRVPSLAAWKDGQGDARKYHRIMTQVGERLAWLGGIGDDCAPAYFAIGVQAYTSSISNIAPELSLALGQAGLSRDFPLLNALEEKYVHPLYALRDRNRGYEVAVMKQAMEILGLKAGPVRPPLQNCTSAEIEEIRRLMMLYKVSPFALRTAAAAAQKGA